MGYRAKTKTELATGHLGACSQATKGPKNKLAVLTGDRINEGLFYKKMYGRFAEQPKKSGRNNEVAVRRYSTVSPELFLSYY